MIRSEASGRTPRLIVFRRHGPGNLFEKPVCLLRLDQIRNIQTNKAGTIVALARITATEHRNVFSTAGQDKRRIRQRINNQRHLFNVDHEALLLSRLMSGR